MTAFLGLAFSAVAEGTTSDPLDDIRVQIAIEEAVAEQIVGLKQADRAIRKEIKAVNDRRKADKDNRAHLWRYSASIWKYAQQNRSEINGLFP